MSTFTNIEELSKVKSIKIKSNDYIKGILKNIYEEIEKRDFKIKTVSDELGISYITFWEYFNKKASIPYHIILRLANKFNVKLDYYFILFETGPRRNVVSLPTIIDDKLAFIIGAHLADGHMRERENKWKNNPNAKHYELVLREEYESNVKCFTKTFNEAFKTNIQYKFNKNHYEFYISNKTIYYFFKMILGIPSGRKADIVMAPDYILKGNKKIKSSFLKGIFMFDGGINYVNSNFCLVSRSKDLIRDVTFILNKLNLRPDYVCLNPDKFSRCRVIIRKKAKLLKLMHFFEENTEKWHRLKEHLYGFGVPYRPSNARNIKELLLCLDCIYPRKRKSATTFSDLVKAIIILKEADLKAISKHINRNKTITYEYLNKLERWGILYSKRKDLNNKVWTLNSKLPDVRR